MRANTFSLFAALAFGGFELATAEFDRPRYLPREVKRVVKNGTLSTRSDNPLSAIWQSIEDSLTGQPSITPTPTPTASDVPKQVIVVISSDAEGHVYTLTTSTEYLSASKPPATTSTSTSATTTTTSDSLLGDVSNLLGLGSSSSTSSTTTTNASSTTSKTATSGAATTTSSKDSLLGAVGSDVSNLLGITTTNSSTTATATDSSTATSTTSSQGSLLESLGIVIPSGETTTSATGSSTIPVSVPVVSSTGIPTTTSSGGLLGSVVSDIGGLFPNASSTSPGIGIIPTPATTTAMGPGSSGIPHPSIPLTSSGTSGTVTATSVGIIPSPHLPGSTVISTPPASQETSKAPPSTSETSSTSTTKTTEEPSTTNSNNWIPSSILVLPSSTSSETTSTGTNSNSLTEPTTLPGSITPSNGVSEAPSDSVLLQIGFDGHLPWAFVATTPLSSSQIFEYVPLALKNALPLVASTMWALEPYYSWQTTGYNATLAIFYFPRDKVQSLKDLKLNPNSALYQSSDESVKTLMAMVDPSIPLEFAGNYPTLDGSSSPSSGAGGSSNGGSSNGSGSPDGSNNSSKANASSVGIGVGVVAGAAAYGAGMFWVARRYRKRKQLHRRSSSTAEQMSQASGAGSLFAAGARMSGSQRTGRSGQMISAPVMAENSLGWN
ncbi:uncharacterized protein N7458_000914 [Penicillium daleae]|uniref:Uncharacterized protein n=1 Tax=Penicillium daleae TaxID=63821 RepID=A0AAD6CH15_9EURO|nr:uncharacterized protein N7458_000914 [Penicillium daleae]KAJ5465228.1 hypothetical protein N7458_000914 [Penicillium daleae]